MTDRTVVTGSPGRASGPLRGQVLGERYEVRATLRNDAFSLGLLAFDQETEDRVVLRIIRPELLDQASRASTYRALRKAVGVGGRFLPGLLDADKDGEFVFAVEPVPEGASLRDVLDERIAAGRPMKPEELLPLVSHLDTALAAVPPPLRHGDVRAENVWVDPHRLWLLGAFVVPALPAGAVAALLQKDSGLRRRLAPETLRGTASDAADRFGVGAIVYEALTLETPPEPGEAAQALPPTPVGEEVRRLLHPDQGLRAGSLEPLVEALSKVSGISVPELDPGTFRAPRRMSIPRPGSVVPPLAATRTGGDADGDTRPNTALSSSDAHAILTESSPTEVGSMQLPATDDDGLPPPPKVSESARTQELRLDPDSEEGPDETAPVTPLSKKRAEELLTDHARGAGLDPRLVRAAAKRREERESAGHMDEEGAEPDDLDPRLVRAALGVQPESEEVPLDPSVPVEPRKDGTQELALDDLELTDDEEDEVPLDPSVPAKPRAEGTQELRLDDLELTDDEEDEVPLDPSVPAKPRAEGTQELHLDDLEVQTPDAGGGEQFAMRAPHAPSRDVGLADLEEMRRRRQAVPEDRIQPIPRPRKDSMVGAQGPVLFDDSQGLQPQAAPEPIRAPAVAEAARRPARATERPQRRRQGRPTERAMPRTDPPPAMAAPSANWGLRIIVISLLLGVAIIVASFVWARHQKEQLQEEKRERIQQRLESLRGGE